MVPSRWSVARDLAAFDQLRVLGWQMRVRTFRRLVSLAMILLLVVTIGVGEFVAHAVLAEDRLQGRDVVTLYVVLLSYVAVSSVMREMFTRRRDVISNSPLLPFFRALDLPVEAVFWYWVVIPVIRVVAVAAAAGGGVFLAVSDMVPASAWALVTIVWLLVGFGPLAAAAMAAVPGRRFGRVGSLLALMSMVPVVIVASRVGAQVIQPSGVASVVRDLSVQRWFIATCCALTVLTGVLVVAGVRRMRRWALVVLADRVTTRRPVRPVPVWSWVALAGGRQILASGAGRLAGRWLVAWLGICAVFLGTGPILADWAGAPRLVFVVCLLSALALIESTVGVAGVSTLRRQGDALVGLGAHPRAVVLGLACPLVAIALIIGIGCGLAAWLAVGHVEIGMVVIAANVAASTFVADVGFPGREGVDGTRWLSLPAAIVSLLSGVAAYVLCAAGGLGVIVAAVATACIGIGGGWWITTTFGIRGSGLSGLVLGTAPGRASSTTSR
ncbi:MAG: hypothetical protein CSA84_07460 [Actinomycetales bacterium]|nr:MAG: hypothetical protein CSA84_07460 [Actinomycetales bacterium]